MAVTRANIEAIIIKRIGKWLTAAGLDGTTNNGTNSDLNDPIARGVRTLGYSVADVLNVSSSDIAAIEEADYDELFDVAELRALQSCLTNYDKVNLSLGPRSESFDQLRNAMVQAIKLKREQIAADYPHDEDARALVGGVLTLDFQQHDESEFA